MTLSDHMLQTRSLKLEGLPAERMISLFAEMVPVTPVEFNAVTSTPVAFRFCESLEKVTFVA